MNTQFFFAIYAFEIPVCILRKIFGVSVKCDLPSEEKCQRDKQQAFKKQAVHKKERRKYHCIVPVIYSASAAALVFHEQSLKRTEEQNTYHVAQRIEDT